MSVEEYQEGAKIRIESKDFDATVTLGKGGDRRGVLPDLAWWELELLHTVTVIEKAKPPVVLPTEPGAYSGRTGSVYVLDANGGWVDYSQWRGSKWVTGPVNYLPLTRLAPVAEVLAKVVRHWVTAPHTTITESAEAVAAEYGATL